MDNVFHDVSVWVRKTQKNKDVIATDQGSMSASMAVVKSSTTQEQLKAAPLCFSFSTE